MIFISNFKGISLINLKAEILLKDFSFKIEGDFSFLIVKGFLLKIHPFACLARAAFYRGFLV